MQHDEWVKEARAFFRSGATLPAGWRRERLRALAGAIDRFESDLLDALDADLHKPRLEAYTSEIGVIQTDIRYARRRLGRWMRPQRRHTPPGLLPARSFVQHDPLGLVLIIGPYNYPFQLLFSPLVSALAAGNCVGLKPSEATPHVSAVVTRLVRECFAPGHVTVFEGGADVAESLLRQPFDHVFFTGSTQTGRKIMRAAAAHPAPVTLELGGKCPCIVCDDVDVRVAARRILWGKCLNAGQTCVAPDYVLVHARIRQAFLDEAVRVLQRFFGPAPQQSPDFGRIVNEREFDRLARYLSEGTVVCGGDHDRADLYIAPTLLLDPDPDSAVMREEIFGPILPVLGFEDLAEVLAFLETRPRPLALYLFTDRADTQRHVLAATSSGGVCINDTVRHAFGKDLPFGGVGASGMGRYHGRAGFECFSNTRSVVRRSLAVDPGFIYPPTAVSLATLKRVYRRLFGS
jgi:aldehyde dehydrogenase (NAD+)